ncbi:MAG: hypothetical protein KKH28_00045 [Elusimicrobia bacterium]|nr:hypothetical protein [Elusimicrobiota bacterium]
MKKKNPNAVGRAVARAMLTEEIAALNARLNFGALSQGDKAELSRMIKLRQAALRRL